MVCEPSAQRCALRRSVQRSCGVPLLDPGIPEVDLELVDLLDQDSDRLPRRAKLLAIVGCETGTPAAEDLEALLV